MTRAGSIRSPRECRSSGFMRSSTMFGASRVPLGVTTNTSGRCFSAIRSTSWPSRHGRAAIRWIHGWSRVTPRARRPKKATTAKAARTMSSTVAPVTEPLMANMTTQATATPAAIFHRFRVRGGSEARACRRIASPCSLIQHRPLDYCITACVLAWRPPRTRLPGSSSEDRAPPRARQRIRQFFQTSGSHGGRGQPRLSRTRWPALSSRCADRGGASLQLIQIPGRRRTEKRRV